MGSKVSLLDMDLVIETEAEKERCDFITGAVKQRAPNRGVSKTVCHRHTDTVQLSLQSPGEGRATVVPWMLLVLLTPKSPTLI